MSEREAARELRRATLIARSAAQRLELSRVVVRWERPLAMADHGLNAFHTIRNHPLWMVGALVGAPALARSAPSTWLKRGIAVFQFIGRLRRRSSAARSAPFLD
jgi:hypothetical protein